MASFLGVIKTVGTDAVKVGTDVVHVVEEIGVGTADAVKLITTAEKLTPQVRAGLATLVTDGKAVATAFVTAGSNPANFVADAAALAALTQLVKDVVSLEPVLKQAVADIKADVK